VSGGPWKRSLRKFVFDVLPEAYAEATGNGALPASARTLFYKVRPLLQRQTDRELKYSYFTQNLLPAYQREVESLPLAYYDPRGELHEPHDRRRVIQLGTREVAEYRLPKWTFNKILYVEKQGLWPVIHASRLAERYDMAVALGQGYPVEAVRALFDHAHSYGDYRIFALHDADTYGYNIARVLAEETKRMPDHDIDVTDLGLTVADAKDAGLQVEYFIRQNALPTDLHLTDEELDWFTGEQISAKKWRCKRVELNAFTSPDLIAYIEAKLDAADATDKIVPPDDVLRRDAHAAARGLVREWAMAWLEERFDHDSLADALVDEYAAQFVTDPAGWVADGHARDRATWWRDAVSRGIDRGIAEREDDLATRLTELLDAL
jgi:hypothetical protein